MPRLAEFRQLEQQFAAQLAELEALKGSSELQKEIEFETKLRDLLATYGCSLRDIVNILDPQAIRRSSSATRSCRGRCSSTQANPLRCGWSQYLTPTDM